MIDLNRFKTNSFFSNENRLQALVQSAKENGKAMEIFYLFLFFLCGA